MIRLGMFENRKEQKQENLCVVRLTTSSWSDRNGAYQRKSLRFLKRKCEGYNILDEDCMMVGADEVINRILNLNDVEDGVYQVVMSNISTCWETGYVDDYDYELVKLEGVE